ncbi:unnamed protein product [Hermetia illucens]|uniref:Uncharacterized protein n=1 Tax=Hermetia illucens TaxID=343691 RepID=A0A7R8YLK7_HERIL|nr:unnamed protein product [Hermetia illucens]
MENKQTVHGNHAKPKKLKHFAKCDDELVPVDIPAPPTKASRRSNSKPKATAATVKASGGANRKSKTSTPSSTPTTQQLVSQNNFVFPVTESFKRRTLHRSR